MWFNSSRIYVETWLAEGAKKGVTTGAKERKEALATKLEFELRSYEGDKSVWYYTYQPNRELMILMDNLNR